MSDTAVTARIQKDIADNRVMLFMKGNALFPAMRLFRAGRADPQPSRRAVPDR